jgi:hypothetical protein
MRKELATGGAECRGLSLMPSLGREAAAVSGYQSGNALHAHSPVPPMLHREPVPSSAIVAIGYDEQSEMLEVEFVSGAVCRYFGVDADVYEDFRAASSKGSFFNRHIKDAYRWESVER